MLALALEASDYIGAAECGKCHVQEFSKQSQSHHARALSPILQSAIAPKLLGHSVQEKNGLRFQYAPASNCIEVTVDRAGQSASAVLQWAFGAGVRGITPVGSVGGQPFEHRVSWYTTGDRAGLTMGHSANAPADIQSALGPKQSAAVIASCFDCHATNAKAEMRPGIECERCHGPGAAHAKDPSVRNVKTLKGLSPIESVQFCGQCHRLPPSQVDAHEAVRFAPIGLIASRCFKNSQKLSCLTCHDAHGNVGQNPDDYVAQCTSCHANAKPAVNCRRASLDNCLACHMPKASTAPYLTFTDHQIRVSHLLASQRYEALKDPARAVAEAQAEIQEKPKSLAGYLQLGQIFLQYDTPQPAVEIYAEALKLAPDSVPAHLGEGLALKGVQRWGDAEKELRLCYNRDRGMAVAFDALASLYLEANDPAKLAAVAQQYVRTNSSSYRGYYYLAAAREREKGNVQEIEGLLRRAIALDPSFAASYALLGKLLSQDGRAEESARELEHAVQLRPDYTPAHLYLANTYKQLNRDGEAAKEYGLVRELNEKQRNKPVLRYHRGGSPPSP